MLGYLDAWRYLYLYCTANYTREIYFIQVHGEWVAMIVAVVVR